MASAAEGKCEGRTNAFPESVLLELFKVVELGSPETLKTMLQKDPALANATRWGMRILNRAIREHNPVHVATAVGNIELLEELASKGAKVNVTNNIGRLPIHEAALGGYTNIIVWLIEKGNPVDSVDNNFPNSDTPLSLAAFNGLNDAVNLLLDKGADVNRQNKKGLTPLHWAVFHGNAVTVETLIRRGAKLNIRSKSGIRTFFGLTPLGVAKTEEDKEMIALLRKHGAK